MAVELLTLVPIKLDGTHPIKLWRDSVLDQAVSRPFPCNQVVRHHYSQYLFDHYMSGDFKGSRARIPEATSLVAVFLQICLQLLQIVCCGMLRDSLYYVKVWRPMFREDDLHLDIASSSTRVEEVDSDDEFDEDYFDRPIAVPEAGEEGFPLPEAEVHTAWRDFLQDSWGFFSIPRVKVVSHTVCFIAYVTFVSIHLSGCFGQPGWMELSFVQIPPLEWVIWLWTGAHLLDEGAQCVVQGLEAYRRSFWNKLDLIGFISILLVAGIKLSVRTEADPEYAMAWCRMLYGIAILLFYVRWLEYLITSRFGGPLLALTDMLFSITSYVWLLLWIMVAFGMCFHVLLPHESLSAYYFSNTYFVPLWALFGAFDITATQEALGYTFPLNIGFPALLGMYMAFVSIIFVNLMISEMGASFEREKYAEERRRMRADIVPKYKDEVLTLPVPLSAVQIFFLVPPLPFLQVLQSIVRGGW